MSPVKTYSYRDDLMTRLSPLIVNEGPTVFFLEGGHFDPRFGVTSFAERSLTDAVDVGHELIACFGRRVRIVFGVLVDDLGLDCGGSICATEPGAEAADIADGEIPGALDSILAASRIVKRARVIVSSERNAKNRGIERLKRKLASSRYALQGTGSPESLQQVQDDSGESIIMDLGRAVVLAEVRNGTWTAKCPMIMAQHYLDIALRIHQRFPARPRIVLVDWSEMLDQSNVATGAQVAVRIAYEEGTSLDVMNVFLGDEDSGISRIHHVPCGAACGTKGPA